MVKKPSTFYTKEQLEVFSKAGKKSWRGVKKKRSKKFFRSIGKKGADARWHKDTKTKKVED